MSHATVREATRDDMPALLELAEHFRAAVAVYCIDMAQIAHIAETLVGASNGTVLVAEHEGRLTGMLGLVLAPHFLSGKYTAFEVCWWAEPDARGHGLSLLRQAEAWSAAHGAERIQFTALMPRVEALYTARGYTALERTFEHVLTPRVAEESHP